MFDTREEISFICVLQDWSCVFNCRWSRLFATVPCFGWEIGRFGNEFEIVTFPRVEEVNVNSSGVKSVISSQKSGVRVCQREG